jgi:hypothetical protein
VYTAARSKGGEGRNATHGELAVQWQLAHAWFRSGGCLTQGLSPILSSQVRQPWPASGMWAHGSSSLSFLGQQDGCQSHEEGDQAS